MHWRQAAASLPSLSEFVKLKTKSQVEPWTRRTVADTGVHAKLLLRANMIPLMTVAGSRSGWPADTRLCPFCDAFEIETQQHLVASCALHDVARQQCRLELSRVGLNCDNPLVFWRTVMGESVNER